MKKAMLVILAFAALSVAALADSEDISGWNEAKWGMTPDQVQGALKYPALVADLAKVCGKKCDEGAALELENYDLNGEHFAVRLWFAATDMHLHLVSMYAKQPDDKAFANIKESLEHSYGSPQSVTLKHGYFIVSWVRPSTIITLYSNAANELTIVYGENTEKQPEETMDDKNKQNESDSSEKQSH